MLLAGSHDASIPVNLTQATHDNHEVQARLDIIHTMTELLRKCRTILRSVFGFKEFFFQKIFPTLLSSLTCGLVVDMFYFFLRMLKLNMIVMTQRVVNHASVTVNAPGFMNGAREPEIP